MAIPLAAAMAALQAVNAYTSAKVDRANARAADRVANAESRINARLRLGSNALEAAKTNFERALQGQANARLLEEGGRAVAVELQNAAREADFSSGASFEQGLQDAERLGAQVAAAAFAGTAGSTVDAINAATALRHARAAETARTYAGYQQFDSAARRAQLASQVVGGMDQSILLETFDLQAQRPDRATPTMNPVLAAALAGASSAWQNRAAFANFSMPRPTGVNIPAGSDVRPPTEY